MLLMLGKDNYTLARSTELYNTAGSGGRVSRPVLSAPGTQPAVIVIAGLERGTQQQTLSDVLVASVVTRNETAGMKVEDSGASGLTIPPGELSGFRVDAFIYKNLEGTRTGFGCPNRESLRGLTETLYCLRCAQISRCAGPRGFATHENDFNTLATAVIGRIWCTCAPSAAGSSSGPRGNQDFRMARISFNRRNN